MPESLLDANCWSETERDRSMAATGAAALAAARAERRRSHRHPHPVCAWLSGQSGAVKSAQMQVMVMNISLHGIGFRTSRALECGTTHWIVIGNGPLNLSARLRVVSCRPQPDGTHHVGAEFF